MMKKLLLALITVSITTNVFAEIYVLEQKNIYAKNFAYVVIVLCINELVFIQTEGNAITQMMSASKTSSRNASSVPYKCKDYINDMKK